MDVGFAAATAEQRAIPVGAAMDVMHVVLVGLGPADRALPSRGRAAALDASRRGIAHRTSRSVVTGTAFAMMSRTGEVSCTY